MSNMWINVTRLRGECTICGRESVLEARCRRCSKQSCGRERCLESIMATAECHVPIKNEERTNVTGDRLTARQWMD
jgi:hypothetical protein